MSIYGKTRKSEWSGMAIAISVCGNDIPSVYTLVIVGQGNSGDAGLLSGIA